MCVFPYIQTICPISIKEIQVASIYKRRISNLEFLRKTQKEGMPPIVPGPTSGHEQLDLNLQPQQPIWNFCYNLFLSYAANT